MSLKISNFKDLENLINLCRRKGVLEVRVDGIEMKLSEAKRKPKPIDDKPPKTEAPSDEEVMFWSVNG